MQKQEIQLFWPDIETLCVNPSEQYLDIHKILDRCVARTVAAVDNSHKPHNILLTSKHGLGKTLMVASLAKRLRSVLRKDIPLVMLDCSEDTKEHHMKGSFVAQPDGSTMFVPGPLPLVIEMANRTGFAMLCLEEISALTPGAQKIVNSITDWRSGIYIPQVGKLVKLNEGAQILVIGTMNPASYAGVYSLNADLRSRFVEEVVPWPTVPQESNIIATVCPAAPMDLVASVAQLGQESRTAGSAYSFSTRDLVILVQELIDLPDQQEAVLRCASNKFEGKERSLIVDRIDAIFKTKLKSE